ncbi:VanZ family protein [Virgibacillus dakarensis]|uniref:VanZ family protein n=1 Tax=Virgibacillus dakarensis TaxID=1917889 RepID=UPI000B43F88F|nr:VanZ family protein [Virgibacillus dakarensis]
MAAFLFTSDINALLSHSALDIHMTSHPDFVFFEIYELSPNLLIQKVGHLLMFAMWLLSIFLGIKRLKTAVWITLGLAVVSELIQPYFSRDGHLLDVAFDSIGILLMEFFIHIFLSATSDINR